ncbi:hypothetical protein [Pseudanabaena sp. UWO311]|uniref:hypothetical protein n=1 Tax=Pseudanabaena sp. UWO311 TaxID=2487337 RepID=UPI0030D7B646
MHLHTPKTLAVAVTLAPNIRQIPLVKNSKTYLTFITTELIISQTEQNSYEKKAVPSIRGWGDRAILIGSPR